MRDESKEALGFDVTDTVLLEIDARLARFARGDTADPPEVDIDFGAALDEKDAARSSPKKR